MTIVPISKIRTDGGTQPRAMIDFDAVDDYTDAMREGIKFPPVIVFYDGSDYWLADGFHRCKAAFAADQDEIACDIHQGTREDAQWYSFSANKANGLRRTNEDKQRAVKAALVHPKAAELSLRDIAKHVGVGHDTVRVYREQMKPICPNLTDTKRTVTRNGATYQQDTANIGRGRLSTDNGLPAAIEVAPEPAPTKRQQIVENAAKRRIIGILSQIRGLCRVDDRTISLACGALSADEMRAFAAQAKESRVALAKVIATFEAAAKTKAAKKG